MPTIITGGNIKNLITKNTALIFIIALYFFVFQYTFDLLEHNLMPITVLFTTYITWLYCRACGLSGIALFTDTGSVTLECEKKAGEGGRLMPIISIAGDNSEAMKHECTKAGMNGTLSKPFCSKEIYRILERHLKQER